VDDHDRMAEEFRAHRGHLRAVAYRMLGSYPEADDALQDAWLRIARADTSDVDNMSGWLTTVVARTCLNVLQSRRGRPRPEMLDTVDVPGGTNPEDEALLADAVGPALLAVLETLAPAERLAFVLHDVFAVPFDDIAEVLERSPAATRQLASRARRRLQGVETPRDRVRQREVVDAFLAASRHGEFDALVALLHPEVVLRCDRVVVASGAARELVGAPAVAETFVGRARAARPAVIDGLPGAVWMQARTPRVVFEFSIVEGRIVAIEMLGDPDVIGSLDLQLLRFSG
jgi:RNA polymerase sigma factor (sigma-70 family)